MAPISVEGITAKADEIEKFTLKYGNLIISVSLMGLSEGGFVATTTANKKDPGNIVSVTNDRISLNERKELIPGSKIYAVGS